MHIFSRFIADFLVAFHLVFIIFVLLGGLLVFWQRRLLYLHFSAVIWGILIEFLDWQCPLTPLEQYFRQLQGQPYQTTFVEQYLGPIIYPAGFTRQMQIFFGIAIISINLVIYTFLILRQLKGKK